MENTKLIVESDDIHLEVWDLKSLTCTHVWEGAFDMAAILCESYILTTCEDKENDLTDVKIWNLQTSELQWQSTIPFIVDRVKYIDGKVVFSSDVSSMIIWDFHTEK